MTTLAWVAGALVVLGIALGLLRRGLFRAGLPRQDPYAAGGAPATQGRTTEGMRDNVYLRLKNEDRLLVSDLIEGLHVVHIDMQRVGDLLQKGLAQALAMEEARMSPPRAEPSSGSARDIFVERFRDDRRESAPARSTSWRDEPRDAALHVQPSNLDWPLDPVTPAGEAWSAPAAAHSYGPSPAAVPVEASNDTVISSVRHPPEAWLERRGGEGEVWLNAGETLSDAGLQRWSTFFDWERREPGARYQTTRPATVTSSGSLAIKGAARPI